MTDYSNEIKSNLERAETNLNAAKDLLDKEYYDIAASRAYYAAFCKARNFLRAQKNVHIPNTGRAHRLVWQWFEGNSSDEVKQIGVEGNRLKEDRRKADYDDAVPNLSSLATEALELSGKIIANLTEIDELNHR